MQQAAIYARHPLTTPGSSISKKDQETTCRCCQATGLAVSPTFRDNAGARNQSTGMISEATRDDSPLDFIVIWKLHRFSISMEETIEQRDKRRQVGTRMVSITERGIDDWPTPATSSAKTP